MAGGDSDTRVAAVDTRGKPSGGGPDRRAVSRDRGRRRRRRKNSRRRWAAAGPFVDRGIGREWQRLPARGWTAASSLLSFKLSTREADSRAGRRRREEGAQGHREERAQGRLCSPRGEGAVKGLAAAALGGGGRRRRGGGAAARPPRGRLGLLG